MPEETSSASSYVGGYVLLGAVFGLAMWLVGGPTAGVAVAAYLSQEPKATKPQLKSSDEDQTVAPQGQQGAQATAGA